MGHSFPMHVFRIWLDVKNLVQTICWREIKQLCRWSGHPMRCLTYTVGGKKKVEPVPKAWVEQLQPMVDSGREMLSAVRELLTANAELLALYRDQQRAKRAT